MIKVIRFRLILQLIQQFALKLFKVF